MVTSNHFIPLLQGSKMKGWDEYTIKSLPISSIELMEKAALTFTNWLVKMFSNDVCRIVIVAGNGNNGGDGLAIARLLVSHDYSVDVFLESDPKNQSQDRAINYDNLPLRDELTIRDILSLKNHLRPDNSSKDIVLIDAIFGTGINKAVRSPWAEYIDTINACKSWLTIVSIDLPSGCPTDEIPTWPIITADYTFSFQIPKLSGLWPESGKSYGQLVFKSIGLDKSYEGLKDTRDYLIGEKAVTSFFKTRSPFSHKGDHGYIWCFCGHDDMPGAALIATKAAYRVGAGYVQTFVNGNFKQILVQNCPEIILSNSPSVSPKASCILMGCGIGTNESSVKIFKSILIGANRPMIIDADGLNILSNHIEWIEKIPQHSILTPHPKEFDRLFGRHKQTPERIETQRAMSIKYKIVIVLKGHHTTVSDVEGNIYYNITGNAGLAKAGSGDALSGIIAGLLAQQYSATDAALIGVYLHGYTADEWIKERHMNGLMASDLVDYLPTAMAKLFNDQPNSWNKIND